MIRHQPLSNRPAPPRSARRRAASAQRAPAPREERLGLTLALLAALWIATLFEPQWFLAGRGISALLKAPVLLFLLMMGLLAIRVPAVAALQRRWTWYEPLLTLLLISLVTVPFAPNPLMAREATQNLFLMWVLVVATVVLIDSARRAELLIRGYAYQFLIWGVLGASTGAVVWHTTLSNFDGFGSFMVIGAALAAVLIAGVVWYRSPRKGLVIGAALLCGLVIAATSTILHGDEYWAELATIAQGTEEATGEDRWEMWKAAWKVFLQHPILGVGAKNWGVFASTYFQPGQLGGDYAENPGMLYNKNLHSSYFQILSEHGLAGVLAFIWIVWDFCRRNLQLRTAAAGERWARMGGTLRLKSLAFGLEAAFIGWLASASLYSQNGAHWFYSILAMNLVVHRLVMSQARNEARLKIRGGDGRPGRARGRQRRSAAHP